MASNKEKLKKAVHDLYIDLYKHSSPSASFDELVENARVETDQAGNQTKIIDYNNYLMDSFLYDNIVKRHMHKNRGVLSATQIDALVFEAYLGCGPSIVYRD